MHLLGFYHCYQSWQAEIFLLNHIIDNDLSFVSMMGEREADFASESGST